MTPGIRASGPSYMKPTPPPVQRPAGTQRAADGPAMVIVRTVAMRQEIVASSAAALEQGIRPGLTLTEARALFPQVISFDHDPLADTRALEGLARWMMRFTPVVSLPLPAKERRPDQDCVYLDITGCDRVFRGYDKLVGAVIDALNRLRLSAGVGVAPTAGAAWALASFGTNGTIIRHEDIIAALSPLPVAALRLDDALRESLHHLGIETIAQLMGLPRSALPSRFGPELLLRLDQALGRIGEPLAPLPWRTSIEAKMEFEGPIESWETIWRVFQKLIGQVIVELTRRGCGARRLDVAFLRADKEMVRRTIALSRPNRDPKSLLNLLRSATEKVDGGDDGFMAIHLRVPLAERIDPEQIALLGGDRYAGEIELAGLIERLSVRLGDEAIARPVLVESHVPERAFTWHASSESSTHAVLPEKIRGENPCRDRPLQLLPTPIEIGVMVSPSEDRDGRPILFRLKKQVHELRHAIGPERISGEWWRGHDKTRDYFAVEDMEGERFWLFRVHETNRWYLHGSFN